jgi:hypothetical protein
MPQRALVLGLRGAWATALVCALLTTLSGCGSTPTLPLPPPVATVGAPSLQGLVRVEGQANDDAYVTVFNEATNDGEIQQADGEGHYAIDIAAEAGDRLLIWQELDGVPGERSSQIVPEAAP